MSRPAPGAELEYVGFWARLWASLLDTLWLSLLLTPLALVAGRGASSMTDALLTDPASVSTSELAAAMLPSASDVVVWTLLPAAAVILFWGLRSATPGKMAIRARIVDAASGAPPGWRQSVVRYVGYFLALLPFGLGLLWVAFDARKQGWHDKLAGTVVVRTRRAPAAVAFGGGAPR